MQTLEIAGFLVSFRGVLVRGGEVDFRQVVVLSIFSSVLASALMIASQGKAGPPSFDCSRAGTPTEFAICASAELSQLDSQLATAYGAAHAAASPAERQQIKAAQVAWIGQRDACGSNAACLNDRMMRRLAELQSGRGGQVGNANPVLGQQHWTFATDEYSWFGRAAPAVAGGQPDVMFRCMAKGVDIASYPGDPSTVSLIPPHEGSLTILISKRLQPEAATAGALVGVSVAVDGIALGPSQLAFLQPEGAFAARVPKNHPMLEAMKRGGTLTFQNLSSGLILSVALRGSSSALTQLETFCNSPRRSLPTLPVLSGTEPFGVAGPASAAVSADVNAPVSIDESANSNSGRSRLIAFGATWFPNTIVEDTAVERKRFAGLVSLALLNLRKDDLGTLLSDQDAAIRQLAHFPEDRSRQIYKSATGRDEEHLAIRLSSIRLTPFEAQRLANEIRQSLPQLMEASAPEFPIMIRLYCYLNLGEYDFSTNSFPMQGASPVNHDKEACGDLALPLFVTVPLSGDPEVDLENFPERLPMEPAQAEALLQALGGIPKAPMYVDAELTAEWETGSPRGSQFKLSLTAAGPYFLTGPSDLQTPIVQMIGERKPTPGEILARKMSGEEAWDAGVSEDQSQLAELATLLSAETRGPVPIFEEPGKYGKLRFRGYMGACEDNPAQLCPFVPNPVNFRVHEDLGIPSDYIIGNNTGGVGSDLISGLGVILPSTEADYRMPMPANLLGKRPNVIFEFDLSDVFLVAGSRGPQPVLMVAGMPTSAGLVRGGDKEPYSWISLPQPEKRLETILEVAQTTAAETPSAVGSQVTNLALRGVRPGLSKMAAESEVRANMSVGWVGTFADLTIPEPFQEGVTAFVSSDGKEQIQLIESLDGTGTVQAIASSQWIKSTGSLDSVKVDLIKQMGNPQIFEEGNTRLRLVWSTRPLGEWSNQNPCFFKVEPSTSVRPTMEAVVGDGQVHTTPAHRFTPAIKIGGNLALKGMDMVSERLETPGAFRDCGQSLVVELIQTSDGILMLQGLVDLDGYQE
ncbi:lysozyme inhibitor LprI family protein [Ruegeria sediminis]|uniref:lysozyme inhibitor LprI family protein n=1 Tax=Ruegeria sediminis TaxID=2583820 RepID=UPI001FEACBDF|nr:lysozyme inhibitor LprI family protein [Ruegeria sediminis]